MLRTYHTAFQSGCSILYSHLQSKKETTGFEIALDGRMATLQLFMFDLWTVTLEKKKKKNLGNTQINCRQREGMMGN